MQMSTCLGLDGSAASLRNGTREEREMEGKDVICLFSV